jgi:hypothetical protein
MSVPEEHLVEREGVAKVSLIFAKELKWLFREQPTSDVGIDAHVEVVSTERPTGRLLALQIKSGESYFEHQSDDGVTYSGDRRHLDYWMSHSLPVAVVLYSPDRGRAFWQHVSTRTAIETKKAWKMVIPWSQELSVDSAKSLSEIAEGDPVALWLRRLEMERPWMELIREGQVLVLDVDEWINKSSGRGDFRLLVLDQHMNEQVVRNWPLRIFPGVPYEELLPQLFPWATIEPHELTYDWADEDRWTEQEGVWDSEDGRYLMGGESFAEWQENQPSGLRPYEVGDEIAKWRLQLKLGPLGEAFLTLHDFIESQLDES